MKREKIEVVEENRILMAMILNDDFLNKIAPVIHSNYFQSDYAQTISQWVLEYWDEYKQAPSSHITDLYLSKSYKFMDENQSELLSNFLTELNDKAESFELKNIEYAIQNAIEYLKLRSLSILKSELEVAVNTGDYLKGEQIVGNYERVEKASGESMCMIKDTGDILSAFLSENETLFTLPGALGKVVGPFQRGDLASWMGAMGRGKTWWLIFTAVTAMRQGLKVLFISLEMPQDQLVRRIWQGIVGQPRKKQKILIPKFIESNIDGKWEIDENTKMFKGVDLSRVTKVQQKMKKLFRGGDLRLLALPAYSSSVLDIVAHLDNMEYFDGFIPDVVCVDYADIVKPSGGFRDYRHSLDDIWKRLRELAMSRNIAVVTATQTNRSGLTQDVTEESVAEDIRKLAHVSKMIGINQTEDEREQSICRIGSVKERDGKRHFEQAVVTMALGIGRPYLNSKLRNEVHFQE